MQSFARNALCLSVRGTGSHHSGVYSLSAVLNVACVLKIHLSIITVSVTRLSSPLGLELIKLTWKLKLAIMVWGVTFPMHACGVRPITMHWVSWPIRADCIFWKEWLCRKLSVLSVREAGHRGTTNNVQCLKKNVFFEHSTHSVTPNTPNNDI